MKIAVLNIIGTRRIVKLLPVAIRKRLPREVVIICIGARESRRINRRYRRKNKPANVLSFRYDQEYGEILVCPAVIRREARQEGVPYKYQMTKMVVHAMVHLAGIHHEKSRKTARKFERTEQRILENLSSSLKPQTRNPKL